MIPATDADLLALLDLTYVEMNGEPFNWRLIPEHMRPGIARWVLFGRRPGDFLSAVIDNDLREAVARADDQNVDLLPSYVRFFYNSTPSGCWGSPARAADWERRGGLVRILAPEAAE